MKAQSTDETLLLPYQTRHIAAFRANSLSAHEKSRRIGVTWGFALEAAFDITRPGGVDFHYFPPTEDAAKKFIEDVQDHAKTIGVLLGDPKLIDDDDMSALRVQCKATGKSIYGHSGNPRRLRGHGGNVLIDEAAHLDDLDEVLKAANALTMWGGSVGIVSTHNGAANPFNRLINEIRAGERGERATVVRTTLDHAVREGLYRRICREQGKEWSREAEAAWVAQLRLQYGPAAREELDVIPAEGDITYLPRPIIQQCSVLPGPVARLTLGDDFPKMQMKRRKAIIDEWLALHVMPTLRALPRDRANYIGQDFGRSHDLSVIAVGHDTHDMRLTVPCVVELRNVPFNEQEYILNEVASALPRFAGAKLDATGNGQVIGENLQRRWGEQLVEAVKITEQVYREYMPRLRAAFMDRRMDIIADVEVMEDLLAVELINGTPKIGPKAAKRLRGRHGDAAIAYMHLVAAWASVPALFDPVMTGARVTNESFGGERIVAGQEYGWGSVPSIGGSAW